MDELSSTNIRLKTALENHKRHLSEQLANLDKREATLTERVTNLNKTKDGTASTNGNVDATPDDHVEINAGGKIIAAKRSTLTQIKDTMLEALFSGRWDKKLQRDTSGRIFLDVNSECFQAIVDYLNEMTISSDDEPPDPPSVGDELKYILQHQMELFGLLGSGVDSKIVKDSSQVNSLHQWLVEDNSDGDFHLLYRFSRDRGEGTVFSPGFHSKCDDKECTLTIIETKCGKVLGGYTNTPWSCDDGYLKANKAFLFVLSTGSNGGNTQSGKLKLMNKNDSQAIYNESTYGPTFGGAHDLYVQGQYVFPQLCGHTYESFPAQTLLEGEGYAIKEMEVFQIVTVGKLPKGKNDENRGTSKAATVDLMLSRAVSDAIDAKRTCILEAELEVLHAEDSFEDEHNFINAFATGDTKDLVALNVSGTVMATKRCCLLMIADSVLAKQFEDANKEEEGSSTTLNVKEWTPDDVADWTTKIEGLKEDVGSTLKENEITGPELLALTIDGLKMLGIKKVGTMCLLQKEIKTLEEKASSDSMPLIEHSPYIFGKILDYLRLKNLYSHGLAEEPALPVVCDSQKKRFEKVVRHYFPGESADEFLSEEGSIDGSGHKQQRKSCDF